MLNNPHERGMDSQEVLENADSEPILEEFEEDDLFQFVWSGGKWKNLDDWYVYEETGRKSRTVMGTFFFYKVAK